MVEDFGKCPNCGAKLTTLGQPFCPLCGYNLSEGVDAKELREKKAALKAEYEKAVAELEAPKPEKPKKVAKKEVKEKEGKEEE